MKLRVLIILVVLFSASCSQISAQNFWEWSDHVALTDSLADNCNPYLHLTHYNDLETLFLFWDRSTDSVSTEIWMDNILDSNPGQLVLSDSGVHYTRPRILDARNYPFNDTLFYLFYESSQNGEKDIYYKAFLADGSFSPVDTLSDMPGDDEQLSIGRDEFYDGSPDIINTLAWINNGNLYASFFQREEDYYITAPQLIDSSTCRVPVICGWINGNQIIYEKTDTSKSYICQVQRKDDIWNSPEIYFDSTDSKNPTRADYWGNVCWSLKMDSVWKVIVEDWGTQVIYELENSVPFDPAIMGIVIGVNEWVDAWIAVEYAEDSIKEIYMAGWGEDFLNFSNSGKPNRKPAFFRGEGINGWCWYDYIIWESYRNGHWQIWSSKVVQCVGGAQENNTEKENIFKLYPNPLTDQGTITFELKESNMVTIVLYNMQGKAVRMITEDHFIAGRHKIRLDAEDLKPGTYILVLSTEYKVYTAKMMKSNQ